jgi:hypothetical protein
MMAHTSAEPVEDRRRVRSLIAAADYGQLARLFVGVDVETGAVQRDSSGEAATPVTAILSDRGVGVQHIRRGPGRRRETAVA